MAMGARAYRLRLGIAAVLIGAGWLGAAILRPAEPLAADIADLWAGSSEPLPAVTLATGLTEAGIHRRWLTMLERRPELQAFDVGIARTPLWGGIPLQSLMLVAESRAELSHVCAALIESGYTCEHTVLDRRQGFEWLAEADGELMPPMPEPEVEVAVLPTPAAIRPAAPVVSEAEWHWVDYPARYDASLVRILGVGDIMMGTDYPSGAWLNPDMATRASVEDVISPELVDLLRAPDITFGNVEGVLAPRNLRSAKNCTNCFSFRSPVDYARFLGEAGFDMVSLANNHSGDFGSRGRASTIEALGEHGIGVAGLDQEGARIAERTLDDGTTVGLIAFAPNIGTLDLRDTRGARIRVEAMAQEFDIVVVSFHGGAEGVDATRVPFATEEYYGEDRGNVHAFAHAMVDAGADIVFGHGPHVPRGVEIYQDRFIAYSLGNFWTYTGFLNWGLLGLGPAPEVAVHPDGRLAGFAIHSTRQAGYGVPELDRAREAERFVLDRTRRDFPGTHERLEALREQTSQADRPAPLRLAGLTN